MPGGVSLPIILTSLESEGGSCFNERIRICLYYYIQTRFHARRIEYYLASDGSKLPGESQLLGDDFCFGATWTVVDDLDGDGVLEVVSALSDAINVFGADDVTALKALSPTMGDCIFDMDVADIDGSGSKDVFYVTR